MKKISALIPLFISLLTGCTFAATTPINNGVFSGTISFGQSGISGSGVTGSGQIVGSSSPTITTATLLGTTTLNTSLNGVLSATNGVVSAGGGATATVASIAALRAASVASIVNGDYIQTAGYYSANDGGGGVYVWNSTSTGTDNGGSVIKVTGVTTGRWLLLSAGSINAKVFGAYGDNSHDDTAPLNAAIAYLGANGGTVYAPTGIYKTTSAIAVPSNINIVGDGGLGNAAVLLAPASTIIHGVHTGKAILNLQSASADSIEGVQLWGDATTTPQTGILLGRALSLASAGQHTFNNVSVVGYFSVAAIYSIASEDNRWNDCMFILAGGGAVHVFYTSQTDELGIGGLGGGSNRDIIYKGLTILNYVSNASCDCVYLDCGANTQAHHFIGGYFAAASGSFVTIQNGLADLSNCPGPVSFVGTSGEQLAGSTVAAGFRIKDNGGAGYGIAGLNISNCYFSTAAGGNFINMDATTFINASTIKVPPQNNGSTLSVIQNSETNFGTLFTETGNALFDASTEFLGNVGIGSASSSSLSALVSGSQSGAGASGVYVNTNLTAGAGSQSLYSAYFGNGTVSTLTFAPTYIGLGVATPSIVGGGLGAAYQLYLAAPPAASSAYSIYSVSGADYLGGALTVGTGLTIANMTTAGIVTNNASGVLASLSNASSASSTLLGLLGSGTPSSSTYLRGDGTWATVSGSGTVTTTGSPASTYLAGFSGATSITGTSAATIDGSGNITGNNILATGTTGFVSGSTLTPGANQGFFGYGGGAINIISRGANTSTPGAMSFSLLSSDASVGATAMVLSGVTGTGGCQIGFSTDQSGAGTGALIVVGGEAVDKSLFVATGLTVDGPSIFAPTARTSGVAPYFQITTPADTGITASTSAPGVQRVTATRTWATTGTVTNQAEEMDNGPTYASASPSQTFTDAATMEITPPIAGSNAIFTRGHTLEIVDSTSAASSITGGLVVSATLGTAATSVGIGGGNIFAGGSITTGAGVTNAAGTWKLGALRTGTALTASTTQVIQIDVGGTLYSLMVCSTNP